MSRHTETCARIAEDFELGWNAYEALVTGAHWVDAGAAYYIAQTCIGLELGTYTWGGRT